MRPVPVTIQNLTSDRAISVVQRLWRGSLLTIPDIKSAYRLLSPLPGDFELLSFKLDA